MPGDVTLGYFHVIRTTIIADGFGGLMPGFNLDPSPGVKSSSPFDSALRFMSLAPYLLMIIPAAMIILGVVIIVKGKKYGESIE